MVVILLSFILLASCGGGALKSGELSSDDTGGGTGNTPGFEALPQAGSIIGDADAYMIFNNTILDSEFPLVYVPIHYPLADMNAQFSLSRNFSEVFEYGNEASLWAMVKVLEEKFWEVAGVQIKYVTFGLKAKSSGSTFNERLGTFLIIAEDWSEGALPLVVSIFNDSGFEMGQLVPIEEEGCYSSGEGSMWGICERDQFLFATIGDDWLAEIRQLKVNADSYNAVNSNKAASFDEDASLESLMDEDMYDVVQSLWNIDQGEEQPQFIAVADVSAFSDEVNTFVNQYTGQYFQPTDTMYVGMSANLDSASYIRMAARFYTPSGVDMAGYFNFRIMFQVDFNITDFLIMEGILGDGVPLSVPDGAEEFYYKLDEMTGN